MLKTFTATEFNKEPAKVFRTADKEEFVRINNERYPDKVFIMHARERGITLEEKDALTESFGGDE